MNWKTDLRLTDVPSSRRVEITCKRCGKSRYECAGDIAGRPKLAQAYFDEAERTLRCADRVCRGPVRLALVHGDKMEGFVGGMA